MENPKGKHRSDRLETKVFFAIVFSTFVVYKFHKKKHKTTTLLFCRSRRRSSALSSDFPCCSASHDMFVCCLALEVALWCGRSAAVGDFQVWEKQQAEHEATTTRKKRETQRNFLGRIDVGSFTAQSFVKKIEANFLFLFSYFTGCALAKKKSRKIYCEIYFPRIISLA